MTKVLEKAQTYQRMAMGICEIEVQTYAKDGKAWVAVCVTDDRHKGDTEESLAKRYTRIEFYEWHDTEKMKENLARMTQKMKELKVL